MYYIGLDVHKRTISYCVKDGSGTIHGEGTIPASRLELDRSMKTLPQPWTAAMEATVFTGWIYDHLQPHAAGLKVAHPLRLHAIAAAKRKTIVSTPTRSAAACGVIFCQSATWPRRPFASGGLRCGSATCWSAKWCR